MHSLITNPADLYEQLGEGQLAKSRRNIIAVNFKGA
jgi:hypothetical protein